MADVDVTVLIATRNRADHIGKCLTTVLEATRQTPFSLEVLVVNNGSSDHTDSVLQDFAAEWPILRIVDDPVPGRSGVLNRTLGVVKG
jgi:glycosyltransferase involved in cell wall biosynthesis